MTTHDIPTVDVSLGRGKARPARDVSPTASVTTTSAPVTVGKTRRRSFGPFRFTAADIAFTAEEIEADLRYGRD